MVVRQQVEANNGAARLSAPAPADDEAPPEHPSRLFGVRAGGGASVAGAGAGDDPDTLYFAFAARTSDDELQDPTISLPRQLRNCRAALPANAVIVAFYWDVESGRKDLDNRGTGAHDKFDLAIPRDGGLPDLLAEAARQDRRFDAVICESVDRIARLMHQSTSIEHDLERVGVPIFAADEGVETTRRKSTKILVRRTKQMLAEWYVRQMLELSWDGFCEHTAQGWNVGAPPYGYNGDKVPHPVPAKREEGLTKTRLVPDAVRGAAVHTIFVLRVTERLSYQAIADRLNDDLDRHPPKRSLRPDLQRATWSASAVRAVLENPKYTGYMVWNRRASKTGNGRVNSPKDWVWSPVPTHEPLVTLDLFKAARELVPDRERSRTAPGANAAHPDTKRSYLLRSYIVCAPCERRMFGKTRKSHAYFACQPSANHGQEAAVRFPAHPASIWVRQDALLDGILRFFADRVLGPDRLDYLAADLDGTERDRDTARVHQVESLRRSIADLDRKRGRLVQRLEDIDDPDGSLLRAVRDRHRELTVERDEKIATLATITDSLSPSAAGAEDLLDRLVHADSEDLRDAPEATLRALFDAFRLRVSYDARTGEAVCRVVLSDDTVPGVHGALQAALTPASAAAVVPSTDHGDRTAAGGESCRLPQGGRDPRFPSAWRPRQDSNLRPAA